MSRPDGQKGQEKQKKKSKRIFGVLQKESAHWKRRGGDKEVKRVTSQGPYSQGWGNAFGGGDAGEMRQNLRSTKVARIRVRRRQSRGNEGAGAHGSQRKIRAYAGKNTTIRRKSARNSYGEQACTYEKTKKRHAVTQNNRTGKSQNTWAGGRLQSIAYKGPYPVKKGSISPHT